jgi:Dyp-type peroxidase family
MATNVEWDDVQGLVWRGYKQQRYARYEILEISEKTQAKNWLRDVVKLLCTVEGKERAGTISGRNYYVNLAFTYEGLKKLDLGDRDPRSFTLEYREGMAVRGQGGASSSGRSSTLGDVGVSAPELWEWGGTKAGEPRVHIVLMIFAQNEADAGKALSKILDENVRTDEQRYEKRGINLIKQLVGEADGTDTEHFGFEDGISQPIIKDGPKKIRQDNGEFRRLERKGLSPKDVQISRVNTGELVLGYKNERKLLPVSPTVSRSKSGSNELPARGGRLDFGKNGTYLVFRQLEQDVEAFETFLDEEFDRRLAAPGSRFANGIRRNQKEWRDWLAAKMVGRWKNGKPLTRYPDRQPSDQKYENDFYYYDDDRDGMRCPIGSHIRRANPRDSLGSNPRQELQLTKLHRILRRARNYGPRYDSVDKKNLTNKEKRGLQFICLNTDIAGQFELVQQGWINNPQFSSLHNERDPLLAERQQSGCVMTVQARPANLRIDALKQFVTVKGGAYFFMPGKRAATWLVNA